MNYVKYKLDDNTYAFKGMVNCPNCDVEYKLNTTDEKLFEKPPLCFKCFMNGENLKQNKIKISLTEAGY